MRKTNNKCVYLHKRLDNNIIFYVGMGTLKRPYKTTGRNIYWKRIVSKVGYYIEIIKENLSWSEACKLECDLINKYRSDNLCNMTDGGDGSKGTSPSKETRLKISEFHKNKSKSNEAKLKMSKAKKGLYLLENNPNSKKVININTNIIFNTLKEASIYENMNYGTFKWAIKNKINFNYKYI
jgi:hypothetical protein